MVPIDDHNCWAWSINYHPIARTDGSRAHGDEERRGHPREVRSGYVHSRLQPTNDYLMDRAAQKAGIQYSGVEGSACRTPRVQESMGPIQDRHAKNLCPTDLGIVRTAGWLLKAAESNRRGDAYPASRLPAACAVVLDSCSARTSTSASMRATGSFAPLDTSR
jgi:hypothetical protein